MIKAFKRHIFFLLTAWLFVPATARAQDPKAISSSDITVTVEQAYYTGSAITPVVTVKDGNTTLGTDDYDISCKGSTLINAKTYVEEIIITGKGNYSGTRYADFTISPKNISLCTVEGNEVSYTGSPITPNITVKDGTTTLNTTDHYSLTVSGAYTYQEPGTYANAITIDGKGNYTGTKHVNFTIIANGAQNLADGKLLVTSNAIYTGSEQVPSASTVSVLYNGATLGTDYYDLTYAPDTYIDAQTYSGAVTITAKPGQASYYGAVTTNYVIASRNMRDVTASERNKMEWTGSIILAPIINNSDGDGNYNTDNINLYYDGTVDYYLKSATPVDYTYTVSPSPIKEAGSYIITFEGRGNFIGTKQLEVHVEKNIGDATVTMNIDKVILPDGTTWNTTWTALPLVVNDGTKTLTIGTDYDLEVYTDVGLSSSVSSITGDGIYYAKFIGKNNYNGNRSEKFYVLKEYYGRTENTISADLHLTEVVSSSEINAKLGNATNTAVIDDAITVYTATQPAVTCGSETIVLILMGIETGAFANCTSLTGLDMIGMTTITEVANGAFAGCTALRYIDLANAMGFEPSSLQRNIAASPFYGVPKQALVYLNSTTFEGENYVYKPGNGSDFYCDVFKVYDDISGTQTNYAEAKGYQWAFENRHNFTASTIVNTRKLTVGQHYTTCLPYDLPIPDGMKAYQLSASSDKLLSFEEVTTGPIRKYTPYVIIPTTSGQLLSTTNAVVQELKEGGSTPSALGANASASTAVNFTMYGTMRYIDGSAAEGYYIMQGKDSNGECTWKKVTSAASNTGDNPVNPCVLPMRAYIRNTTGGGTRAFMSAIFTNADGSTTAIDGLIIDQEDTTVYDLQGRKVQNPQHQGLYIKNGRKIVIK